MAEAFVFLSAIQAASQLVEQACRILERLRLAHERQKGLPEIIRRHQSELNSIKIIVGVIDDEEDLQTPVVATELSRLEDVQKKLKAFLKEIDPKETSKMKQFARQLTQGSFEERKLASIMGELGQVKAMLLLRIQVTSVGVMRTMEKQLVANAEVIERIDRFLREQVDESAGLRIAKLLKGRRPSTDGTVLLTESDLRALAREGNDDDDSGDETLVDDDDIADREMPLKMERIILRNCARNQALQINAAVGEDIWKHMTRLVVKDNVAEDQAVQINYGTTLDVTMQLLGVQTKRLAISRP